MKQPLFKSITYAALTTAVLLLIPLFAMKFSDDVAWTLSDFILAGFLIFGTWLTYILVTRKSQSSVYRTAAFLALFTSLLLIWSNLAVGIIGSENNGINLIYFSVIAVGITGAIIARFKPEGMAVTMFAMAGAQIVITLYALAINMDELPGSSVTEIIGVNSFFTLLFVMAALLFLYAARNINKITSGVA